MARKVRQVSRIDDPQIEAQIQEIMRVINDTGDEVTEHGQRANPHYTRPEDIFSDKPESPVFDTCDFIWNITARWHRAQGATFYELRVDGNWGQASGRLYYGSSLTYSFTPTHRNYTLYLKSVNAAGIYSDGYATITITKDTPGTPDPPTLTPYFNSILIEINPISDYGILGYYTYVTEGEKVSKIPVDLQRGMAYAVASGITISVQVSAYDILGEGGKSTSAEATPKKLEPVDIPEHIMDKSKLSEELSRWIDDTELGVGEAKSAIDTLSDQITLKVQKRVSDDKNVVTGIGVAIDDENVSEVGVLADRFKIYGSVDGEAFTVFAVDTSVEPPKVYIIGDLLADGSISGKKLMADALTSRNFNDTQGSQFDLESGTLKLGGALNPKLSFDGDNLKLIGSVVQSPSGVESRIPVWRGAYVPSETYFQGDVVTYDGSTWICQNDNTTGIVPESGTNWQMYAAKGDTGEPGIPGQPGQPGQPGKDAPIMTYQGEFDPTKTYYNNATRRDGVHYKVAGEDNEYWLYKGTDGSYGEWDINNWQPFGAEFDSVATKILLTDDATITKRLFVEEEGEIIAGGGAVTIGKGGMSVRQKVSDTDDLKITTDTYLDRDRSDLNHGTDAWLFCSGDFDPMLKIPLPQGITSVQSAKLMLYVTRLVNYTSDGDCWNIQALGNDWDHLSVTRDNFTPVLVGDMLTYTPDEAYDEFVEFDITPIVNSWLAGDYPNYGIILSQGINGDEFEFASADNTNTNFRPYVAYEYAGSSSYEERISQGDIGGKPWGALGAPLPAGTVGLWGAAGSGLFLNDYIKIAGIYRVYAHYWGNPYGDDGALQGAVGTVRTVLDSVIDIPNFKPIKLLPGKAIVLLLFPDHYLNFLNCAFFDFKYGIQTESGYNTSIIDAGYEELVISNLTLAVQQRVIIVRVASEDELGLGTDAFFPCTAVLIETDSPVVLEEVRT